jgi:hypothetical protein
MSDPYDDLDRAHRLIGRFLWAFANVECDLNELLIVLFDLNETAKLILLNSVDVRKKIDWAVIAMREPPSSISDGERNKLNKALHELHDIRNIIVHSTYFPEPPDGIKFVHTIARNGKLTLSPENEKTVHTFASLDGLFSKARAASALLEAIRRKSAAIRDVTPILNELLREPISSQSNVIPFPSERRD